MIRYDFNKDWKVTTGSGSALNALFGAPADTKSITLPHDAMILREHDMDCANGSKTGYYDNSTLHYTKSFIVAPDCLEKVHLLEFEGVYMNTVVYINNAYAGQCMNGYTNFYVDATKFIHSGENHVKVVVKNEPCSGRWYTGEGIYRNVKLMVGSLLHIKADGVKISTPEITSDVALVQVCTTVENSGICTKTVVVQTVLKDPNGQTVATDRAPVTVPKGESPTLRQRIAVPSPLLWDIDMPNLYTCHTDIFDEEHIIDIDCNTFGIRSLSLDSEKGFRLNGRPIKLRGGCIHHDNGIIGAVTLEWAEERRIRLLKKAGYNALRSSHNPISKAMLDACDRIGMLVMDELTDNWTTCKVDYDYGLHFAECWEHDITQMVHKCYNHPSVIMYSIGNEIPETGNRFDVEWGRKLSNKIRELDNTRYTINSINFMLSIMDKLLAYMSAAKDEDTEVTAEINTLMNQKLQMLETLKNGPVAGKATEEAFAQVDIAGYNYAAARYKDDLGNWPNRIIVGSETNLADLDKNWELVEDNPNIIGDFVWTCWDYLGEAGIGCVRYGEQDASSVYFLSGYCLTASAGDLDLIGDRRASSFWRNTIWGLNKEPYIAVQNPARYSEKQTHTQWSFSDAVHSWSWEGYEGKSIVVEVYSDADEIELLINNTAVERRQVGLEKKCIVKFDTQYQPGIIEAVAYKKGHAISKSSLHSAGKTTELHADVDRAMIKHNDLAYISISLTDENGILKAATQKSVTIAVEGAGVLQGFGSADPYSKENFFDETRTTFNGRLLAAIRSGYQNGEITVNISADGCETRQVLINVTAQD